MLTCMDARLDPAKLAGLAEGDAHVIRNAGMARLAAGPNPGFANGVTATTVVTNRQDRSLPKGWHSD
jgi:hypothetical protein